MGEGEWRDRDDPAYGFAQKGDDTREVHVRIIRAMAGASQDAAWALVQKTNEIEAMTDQAAAAELAHDLIHLWASRLTDLVSTSLMALPCVRKALEGGDLCDQDENLDGRSVH